ncbi:DNA cytosine methyltransferase [Pseudomonas sp. 91RF]|jgi:DNA (cytosine-5)-methyltransferase 1|uniref:DNA cytosine methyltransferase n=1 Tax=Pseudomonas sp. 91RF TaxID=2292261 RepID=UPI000E6734D2|nr:DNA cytosine methyltransferase [Pseudomonas sp. 91RF]RIJ09691.1 DNA cytosine methyltransferase [Pseudomonas sp. 91RF]
MEHHPNHPQYASVCSGIEAVSVAWQPLGLKPAWFSEIDAFPSAVLAHHYPDVPNLGDMTLLSDKVLEETIPAPPILIGGTPCQDFSVAGFRAGLSAPRGALSLKFVELANAIDEVRSRRREPKSIVVWENVPGVLSDKRNAFGCLLGALAGEECELHPPRATWSHAGIVFGPQRTVAWRILDAQYFGVAQRRRRVFLVASAREDFDPAAVLFESESPRRDIAPHRTPQTDSPAPSGAGTDANGDGLDIRAFTNSYGMSSGQGGAEANLECCPTLTCNHDVAIVVCSSDETSDIPLAEDSGSAPILKRIRHRARRLLPQECERLQGLPSGYTRIPRRHYTQRRISRSRPEDLWEPKDSGWMLMAADGPRYTAIGNTMAVPCLVWIGKRLLAELSKSGG